jgi:methyl-accepting chemotaxis protein
MHKQSEQVDENWLPSIMSLGDVSQDLLRLRALTLRLLLNTDEIRTQQNLTSVETLRSKTG